MNTRSAPPYSPSAGIQPHHITDYLRVIYKRRWTAALALVAVFIYSAMGILKQTPIYEASAQLLIDKEARRATSLNTVLGEQPSYYDDDFYPTQVKILQSRGLGWKTIQSMGLDKPAKQEPKPTTTPAPSVAPRAPFLDSVMQWVSNAVGAPKKIEPPPPDETTV